MDVEVQSSVGQSSGQSSGHVRRVCDAATLTKHNTVL